MNTDYTIKRLRRRRSSEKIRRFFSETSVSISDLILPVFVTEKDPERRPISTLPGHHQWPILQLPRLIQQIGEKGIQAVILFGIPRAKDSIGNSGYQKDSIVCQALDVFRRENANITTIADVCMCEYTDHGQCGILDSSGTDVDNDTTLPLLAKAAVAYAQAGADIVAPSDMMDGRVRAIRAALDKEGFAKIPVLSYAAKFASSFYGPFREAAESAPQVGNRRGYQMNVANFNEALEEIETDLDEGSDGVIIKPAISSLDIIHHTQNLFRCPVVAYQVSGEYCMIQACAEKGWIDLRAAAIESLLAIKRAGARRIISYFALDFAGELRNS